MMMQPHGRMVPVFAVGRHRFVAMAALPRNPSKATALASQRNDIAAKGSAPSRGAIAVYRSKGDRECGGRFVIGEQLGAVEISDPTTVLEPVGRNTVPGPGGRSPSGPDAMSLAVPVGLR
jgi:hypothetical protein